jgi:hypothetical protein
MNSPFQLPKKSLPQENTTTIINNNNNNNNNNSNNGISHIKDKHNRTIFPNIQLKFSTIKEIESIIISLKPKNTCGYNEVLTKLLKISSAFIT